MFQGDPWEFLTGEFERCENADALRNGVGIDNEEENAVRYVCRGPKLGWDHLWPRLRHLD